MTRHRLIPFLLALAWPGATARADFQGIAEDAVPALIQKIQGELAGPLTDDSKPNPAVPHGEIIKGMLSTSTAYPGTEHAFKVYIPAQFDPARPACLLFCFDGIPEHAPTVLDNLIAKGDMPVTIAVGLSSGVVWKTKGSDAARWDRSYEFDSTDGRFAGFVLDELLPAVERLKTADGRRIRISKEPGDRAATGGSTGGIGSFTLAWERPDSFSRVYSTIGTFVSMRGGNDYPAIIRKTDPKPIRIFLEDGSTDAWNPLFGSWFAANENMEAALSFSGYDVQHAWGVHGHDGAPGNVIFPDVMRWLWRGWPAPVQAGVSRNDMLAAILRSGEGWERVGGIYLSVAALAGNGRGEVCFFDASTRTIDRVGEDGKVTGFRADVPNLAGEAFGPDGTLFATVPASREVLAFDGSGSRRTVAADIRGNRILVDAAGEIIVSEPGLHADEPGAIWRLGVDGTRKLLEPNLPAASGIALSPDGTLVFAAQRTVPRVTSYVVGPGGTLVDREANYWIHAAAAPADPGAEDLASDMQGSLYVATPLGVQVCDRNGRVRAILWLPSPSGPTEGICWGGEGLATLYATDGRTLFRRRMAIPGFAPWAAPVALPKANAG